MSMNIPTVAPPEPESELECEFERVGRIVAVTGGHAIILLDAPEFTSVGQMKGPEIGTLLKVDTPHTTALALVSALSAPAPSHEGTDQELRIAEVEFIGELPKGELHLVESFRRGISAYPALGDVVGRASQVELARAYSCDTTRAIRIGHIHQDASIPAMAKLDELLGKHFAVLGTTGTGKSCVVALILRRILETNPQAHILLLDVHREYAQCFREGAEIVTPDNLNLPFWFLNFEEIVEILIGSQPNRDADIEILRELIPMAKLRYAANQRRDRATRTRELLDIQTIGIDTPVPYRASELISLLDEHIGKLDLKGELAPYKRLKSRVETISRDPRYAFMFGSLTVQDTMAQALGRLFRIPVGGRPITILELGGLPSEIINVVVSVLARMAFDFGVWSGGRVPLTFICEEAHRYVPIDRSLGFEPTKRAISRIAKEGRKYAIGLCVVSQRPAELDPSILSQCNTVFSLRLSNERDQDILKAGISDAAASLLEFMPTMGQGEAIAFGEGVSLPSRITFDRLPSDAIPRTTTATFSESWASDVQDNGFLADVVARWRLQSHFSFNETAPPEGETGAPPAAPNGPAAAGRPVAAPAAAPVGPSQPFGRAHNTREPSLPPMRGFGGGSRGFGRNS
jgi:hypothetical protein